MTKTTLDLEGVSILSMLLMLLEQSLAHLKLLHY